MKNAVCHLLTFALVTLTESFGQANYPFMDSQDNRDILAYWYDVPRTTIQMEHGGTRDFSSLLQIYGRAPADEFNVRATVFLKDGKRVFEKTFDINRSLPSEMTRFRDDFFNINCPVQQLGESPSKISIVIKSPNGERKQEIICRYHKLQGRVTDFKGNPLKSYVAICPDSFVGSLGFSTDTLGNYDLSLPERTYNAIVADKETYGVSTLEVWGWHIIMDSDQRMDFKMGNGEVYNMHVWPNNGGGSSYFVSFRPMVLPLTKNIGSYTRDLNGNEFSILNTAPELEPQDVKVKINGKEAEIISLQKYFETGSPANGIVAYLAQVKRTKEQGLTGKLTVSLEYEREIEIDGKKVLCNSMGYFQFYLNYAGVSEYF